MDILTIVGFAVALAMDAFAVSIAVGVGLKKLNPRQVFRLAWHFGLFQALMPLIGWGLGYKIRIFIESFDHWIAFCLLGFVGFHMIKEAISGDEDENRHSKDPTKGLTMIMLSVATSIDALAVGFSLSILNVSIIFPAIVIGIVALCFTIAGLFLGKLVSNLGIVSKIAELSGGIILWSIGLKIIYEHHALDFLL